MHWWFPFIICHKLDGRRRERIASVEAELERKDLSLRGTEKRRMIVIDK